MFETSHFIRIDASVSDRRVVVLRNGIEIGRARIDVVDPQFVLGTHAGVARHTADTSAPTWVAIDVPGHEVGPDHLLEPDSVSRLRIPDEFVAQLFPLIEPETTLLVTDGAILPETHAVEFQVINSDPLGDG